MNNMMNHGSQLEHVVVVSVPVQSGCHWLRRANAASLVFGAQCLVRGPFRVVAGHLRWLFHPPAASVSTLDVHASLEQPILPP